MKYYPSFFYYFRKELIKLMCKLYIIGLSRIYEYLYSRIKLKSYSNISNLEQKYSNKFKAVNAKISPNSKSQ